VAKTTNFNQLCKVKVQFYKVTDTEVYTTSKNTGNTAHARRNKC